MNNLETFDACIGNWQGTNRLHDPTTGRPEETLSDLTVARIEDETGEAIQLDYTWVYQGEPQHGTLSLREEAPGQVTATWIDTWHSSAEMTFREEANARGELSLLGSYAAPTGPDWGWRIVLEPGDEAFQVRMYNILPDGPEEIAVEAVHTRRV